MHPDLQRLAALAGPAAPAAAGTKLTPSLSPPAGPEFRAREDFVGMEDVLETELAAEDRTDARDREHCAQGFDSEDPSGFDNYQPSCFQQPDSSEGEVIIC